MASSLSRICLLLAPQQKHYRGTKWEELSPNVMDAASSLGWEESVWSTPLGGTALYAKKWSELSEDEKSAAYVLCHFDVSWPGGGGNSINLLNWNIPMNDASQSLARVSILLTVLFVAFMF
jgi:hypothetical protein